MSKYKIIYIIICIPFIVFIIIKGRKEDKIEDRKKMELWAQYPHLKFTDTLYGVIKKFEADRGALRIDLLDKRKVCLQHSRNYEYDKYCINDFVRNGDTLVKNKNSDTIFIHRENKKYYFILGEFIVLKK